ncbi:MAG: sodium/alanine symporter protein [Chlamydiae bacterium CG10_big_fil_rev_8_21_14_0_10_42_34]|nr:MAG: sodium/alanine symporter protein [Chlamydiae bacterium CG10_big_fil_rev_8_21_14_0_10_42_34]
MIFDTLEWVNEFVWGHIAFALLLGLGLYFSIHSRFFQIRKFGSIFRSFISFFEDTQGAKGIHPVKVFFASIGGCIGIGNVVGIVTAIQIGGPGALFWTWIGGLFGMLLQYSEVYLGLKHRIENKQGGYDGGPMYFLPLAYKGKWIAPVICFLLCIYGVEIFMFNVMADSLSVNWNINLYLVVATLLVAILVVAKGGINRVGEICSALIPLFILIYVFMSLWVIFHHTEQLPSIFRSIFEGAFTAQAAKGAFAGSTVMLTISMGLSRGAYSGDIGVGYTSVIYAESATKKIGKQAAMTIIGIFLDTFVICTLSILVVLSTGNWHTGTDVTVMVQEALGAHFPYMHLFMPAFLFLLGYTTILTYFVVGAKCAKFISKKWGPTLYYIYACIALPLFAFVDATQAFVIMSLSGALLLTLNLIGIFLLRKQVHFNLD